MENILGTTCLAHTEFKPVPLTTPNVDQILLLVVLNPTSKQATTLYNTSMIATVVITSSVKNMNSRYKITYNQHF